MTKTGYTARRTAQAIGEARPFRWAAGTLLRLVLGGHEDRCPPLRAGVMGTRPRAASGLLEVVSIRPRPSMKAPRSGFEPMKAWFPRGSHSRLESGRTFSH